MDEPKSLSQITTEYIARNIELYLSAIKKSNLEIYIPVFISDRIFNCLTYLIDHKQSNIKYYDALRLLLKTEWKVQNIEFSNYNWTLDLLYNLVTRNEIVKLNINFYTGFYFGIKLWQQGKKSMHRILLDLQKKDKLEYLGVRNMQHCKDDDECLNKPIVLNSYQFPRLKVLDLSSTSYAWYIYVDKYNPPPIKSLILENQDKAYGDAKKLNPNTKMQSNGLTAIFTQFSIVELQKTLTCLVLHGSTLTEKDFVAIFHLQNLTDLDISLYRDEVMGNEDENRADKRPQKFDFFTVVSKFPKLQLLDISGTEYGDNLFQNGIELDITTHERAVKLPLWWKRDPLKYLGLWKTDGIYLNDYDKIAQHIFGERDEESLLLAMIKYKKRSYHLAEMWRDMHEIQRTQVLHQPIRTFLLALDHIETYHGSYQLILACAANLSLILRYHYDRFTSAHKQRLILSIVDFISRSKSSPYPRAHLNCIHTLFCLNRPHDFLPNFEVVSNAMLHILKYFKKENLLLYAMQFINGLLSCEEVDLKKYILSIPFISALVNLIEKQLHSPAQNGDLSNDDEPGERPNMLIVTAWSGLWNATDELPSNCAKFIELKGLEHWLKCYKLYHNRDDVRNHDAIKHMMGLMGNIAEVSWLREHISNPVFMNVFSNLLHYEEDGIEIKYNACGILSHIVNDKDLKIDPIVREETAIKMFAAVVTWDISAERSINYRSLHPITNFLRCGSHPSAQLWGVWALCSLTTYNDKFSKLLIQENSVILLQMLIKSKPNPEAVKLAQIVLDNCEKFMTDESDS